MILDVLDREEQEQKELTVKHLSFSGTGGTDIEGEWQWSGNYEMNLSRKYNPSLYNFYASIRRRRSRNSWKTIGWSITLYLSMYYSNGRDIKVLEKRVKSLKSAKQAILEKIQELHADAAGTEQLINEWKKEQAQPVFALESETGKPTLIGTSYISCSVEMDKDKETLWFNEDLPDYSKYRTFYSLEVSGFKPVHFYAYKTERMYNGHCGSSEKDEALVHQMVEMVKDNPKYAWLFKKLKDMSQ